MENGEFMNEEGIDIPEIDDIENIEEVVEEEQDDSESLESLMDEGGETVEETVEQPEEVPKAKEEPGYVRGRIEKAVNKAIAETEARMRAEFETQMAPFRARMMEDEAQELVRSRKVTDIETARELVRLRNGQPAVAQAAPKPAEQPRQANGQFAAKEDPGTSARISMLEHQADRIKEDLGIDVTAEFMNNEEIKRAVVTGEMDFYDVAKQMQSQQTRKRPPSPMRSPNGASGVSPNAIANMTDEQFERMERNIKERGARYELK